jgi:AcrR family transcriptional regulator
MIHAVSADDKTGYGRGPKGARTRRRIMDATAAMLAERPFAEIRITEIARAAGTTQANFYTYFTNIEDVILVIAREVNLDDLAVHLEPDWEGEAGLEHARQLMNAAISLWRRHRGVLSIVGHLADKQVGEFAAVRVRQVRQVYKAIEMKVRKAQAAGRISLAVAPRLVGYEGLGIIGATGDRYELLINSGFSHATLVETNARLLHMMTTGERL